MRKTGQIFNQTGGPRFGIEFIETPGLPAEIII